jgi:hypothetical protein
LRANQCDRCGKGFEIRAALDPQEGCDLVRTIKLSEIRFVDPDVRSVSAREALDHRHASSDMSSVALALLAISRSKLTVPNGTEPAIARPR